MSSVFNGKQYTREEIRETVQLLCTNLELIRGECCDTIEGNMVLVTGKTTVISIELPNGYTSGSDQIDLGFIMFRDISENRVSLTENLSMPREITLKNREKFISEIMKMCNQ